LPLAYMAADRLTLPDGTLLARRYVGPEAMSDAIADTARDEGLSVVVATRRDVIADLFHAHAGSELAFYAPPPSGKPESYYEQTFALPQSYAGDLLYVAIEPPDCPQARDVGSHAPGTGVHRNRPQGFWRMPASCLRP
jgi:hypothetical protein